MYSKATQILFDEHEIILKAIEQVKAILQNSDLSSQKEKLLWYIQFFREYGDQYHHQKEENILFRFLEEKNEMLGGGLITSLTEHHTEFRESLRNAETALQSFQWSEAKKILQSYLSDLTVHIGAENDELFISTDTILSEQEKENLYFQYLDKDRDLGEEKKRDFEKNILGNK